MADSGEGWSERVRTPQTPTGGKRGKRRPKHLKPSDEGSYGWAIIGFFMPYLGLILACVWRRAKPKSARAAGLGALVYIALLTLPMLPDAMSALSAYLDHGSRYVETNHGNNSQALAVGHWGSCEWVVDRDGLLVVYPGEGADTNGGSPWSRQTYDITAVRFEEGVTLPKSCWGLLSGLKKLKSADLSSCDSSKATDMYGLFAQCAALKTVDVSRWDTSEVEDMGGMFYGCSSLEGLDVSKWDTSEVKEMGCMFQDCSSLKELDVSEWGTSKANGLSGMFYGCSSLEELDVSEWETAKANYMNFMFYDCSSLERLDVSKWDTSKVEDMNYMFSGCSSLEELDVSEWDTSQVEDMGRMFDGCSSLKELDVSNWDTQSVTKATGIFSGCESVEELDVSKWDVSGLEDITFMFGWCSSLRALDLSGWDTTKVGNSKNDIIGDAFPRCTSLSQIKVGDKYLITRSKFFPKPTSENGKWYSTRDKVWYTVDEIVSERSGFADTYTNGEDSAAEDA